MREVEAYYLYPGLKCTYFYLWGERQAMNQGQRKIGVLVLSFHCVDLRTPSGSSPWAASVFLPSKPSPQPYAFVWHAA